MRSTSKRNGSIVLIASGALLLATNSSSAQTPVQSYWDWAELDFEATEYQTRRESLIEELAAINTRFLLIPSAQGTSHGPTFRQLDDFHYWTGLELPSSVLVFDAEAGTAIIYAPGQDARFANPGRPNDFPGRPLADDPRISERAGVEIQHLDALAPLLASIASSGSLFLNLGRGGTATAVTLGLTPDLSPEQLLVLSLKETFPQVSIGNAFKAIARVRAVKSPAEIAIIRQVAKLTERAIAQAAAHVEAGIDERSLEGWFELGCKQGGAQSIPFHPIVKSGPNSLWPWRVLAAHYERRNRVLRDGELIIFDVGCELNHYVSDVGRTFPVSGTFSPEQAAALSMQQEVSAAIIAAIRPGVTLAEVQTVAEAAIPPSERPYMQTGSFFSHHLGLSTGDPVLTDEPLRAGMVFTVEPWYYNHDSGVSVFIEDMILVTENGAEILTSSLPRSSVSLGAMTGKNR